MDIRWKEGGVRGWADEFDTSVKMLLFLKIFIIPRCTRTVPPGRSLISEPRLFSLRSTVRNILPPHTHNTDVGCRLRMNNEEQTYCQAFVDQSTLCRLESYAQYRDVQHQWWFHPKVLQCFRRNCTNYSEHHGIMHTMHHRFLQPRIHIIEIQILRVCAISAPINMKRTANQDCTAVSFKLY